MNKQDMLYAKSLANQTKNPLTKILILSAEIGYQVFNAIATKCDNYIYSKAHEFDSSIELWCSIYDKK